MNGMFVLVLVVCSFAIVSGGLDCSQFPGSTPTETGGCAFPEIKVEPSEEQKQAYATACATQFPGAHVDANGRCVKETCTAFDKEGNLTPC